jgi:hypothetical protein
MAKISKPALIIGGSGTVGAQAARTLRRLQPDLPIAIGGRDVAKAEAVAREIGRAVATKVDIALPDLGLRAGDDFSAVVVFLKDERLNTMRYAQEHGIPYISLSSGTFEIGPEIAQFIHAPNKAPILLASHWLAGASLFPALHLAKAFRSIDNIRLGVLLDEQDMGGPAAFADFERITQAAPAALALADGKFVWTRLDEAQSEYTSVDGVALAAQPYSPFDIISLATATSARSIRMDLAYTVSASRRRGEPFSTEIVVSIDGVLANGQRGAVRHEIVHPDGQAPLTALCVALAVERILGLTGADAPAAGLYFPEILLDPADVVQRMQEFGARFSEVWSGAKA